jgi:uncharacterized protein (TIGR03435 family)
MTRVSAAIYVTALTVVVAFGQSSSPKPTFEITDVHASPRSTNSNMRISQHEGRYEVRNANMVDLIRTAYTIDADKVVGGPTWLEYDRFDVIGKFPANTSPETLKLMLQSLLSDRFKLVVHNDTQPIAGFVLTLGKGKHKLKEGEPSGKTGCERLPPGQLTSVAGQISVPAIGFSCHNTTMEALASSLRGFAPDYLTNTVVDSTALKGAWDFDLKWTSKGLLAIAAASGVTLFDAIDKQLGLKLEEQKLPTPVIVVDQVNKKPTDNPPDLDAKLPALPPAEFEVADIKPTVPGPRTGPTFLGFLPGGRVNLPGFPLRLAISMAWSLTTSNGEIQGAPKWLDTAQFDIVAKAPASVASGNGTPPFEDLAPMLQALLKDRFKMKVHYEDQQVTAYTLVAAKPKLKKADPAGRTGCKMSNGLTIVTGGPLPVPPRVATCQNITMAQFADQLQIIAGTYVRYPVLDGTGIEGAWDFNFSFSPIPPNQLAGLRGANPFGGPAGAEPGASDPIGGTSFFDAVEKQLGLKLEAQKRSYPVFVIDHIEEKPTDN